MGLGKGITISATDLLPSLSTSSIAGHDEQEPATTPGSSNRWRMSRVLLRQKARKSWPVCKPWAMLALAVILVVAPILILFYAVNTYSKDSFANFQGGMYHFYCLPNGTLLPLESDALDISIFFDFQNIFTINLAFGRLTFNTAKTIDVIWDVVVGRGGQVIVALVSFRVLSRALLFTVERTSASFDLYAATAFGSGTFTALWSQLTEMAAGGWRRGQRSCLILLASILATLYVVSFPTLLSAISGYQAIADPMVPTPDPTVTTNGRLVSTDLLQTVGGIIVDGSRIGLTDNFPLPATESTTGLLASPWMLAMRDCE